MRTPISTTRTPAVPTPDRVSDRARADRSAAPHAGATAETSPPGSPGPSTPLPGDGASDAALLRRVGLGDGAAFEELFARHFSGTFNYALRMLDGEDALAQDAAQDAWIKVLGKAGTFRGEAAVRTWLFAVVAHAVTDLRRRRRPVVVAPHLLAGLDAGEDGGGTAVAATWPAGGSPRPSAEQTSLDHALWDALALALSELPWRQRACWVLREDEGMSYAEIAHVLDTTPTVVRGQLHRAKRSLAIRMEEWR